MTLSLKFKYSLHFFVFSVVLHFISQDSFSQSCHGGGGASGFRLASNQHYQFGITNSYQTSLGWFDALGYYTPNENNTFFHTMTTTVGGGYRLGEQSFISLKVPFVYRAQQLREQKDSSSSVGDPHIGISYLVWDDIYFLKFRPELNIYGGIQLPVGTSPYNSKSLSGIDVSGEGLSILSGGVAASKLYRPLRISLEGSFLYPFSRKITRLRGEDLTDPYLLKRGERFQFLETINYSFSSPWNASLGFKHFWQLHSKMNGVAVMTSAERLFSSSVAVNYSYDSTWNLGLNYETTFPFYRYLVNQPQSQTISLALTYGS